MSNEQMIDIKGPLIGEIEVPGDKVNDPSSDYVGVFSNWSIDYI